MSRPKQDQDQDKPQGTPGGPPEEIPQIPISKEIIQPSKMTSAVKDDDGRLHVTFVAIEGGMAVSYTWIVEEAGQKNIMDVMTGGIVPATLADIPKERADQQS